MIPETYLPILVTGATGQVGGALARLLGDDTLPAITKALDLSHPELIPALLDGVEPGAIINAAAYTAVDRAEEEEELAHIINADAVEALAGYAFRRGLPLVHYSTDYVFPGGGTAPWREDYATAPLNAYGRSKLDGELAIIKQAALHGNARYLIFRTSWVYDETGRNFLNTMLRLGAEREAVSVVADQCGAPTYAGDLARLTLEALEKALAMEVFPSGIYHLCNSGETNWRGFAESIFRIARGHGVPLKAQEVMPLASSDYKTAARRPLNSRLDMTKLRAVFGIAPPSWEDALARCLKAKFGGA